MNLPRFNAEGSLYPRRHYRLKAGWGDGATETAVFPSRYPNAQLRAAGRVFQTQRLPREDGGAVAIQPFV